MQGSSGGAEEKLMKTEWMGDYGGGPGRLGLGILWTEVWRIDLRGSIL
jgi:hypothetical protein